MATHSSSANRIRGKAREELAHALRRRVSGEVGFDAFSRVLYSTDASIYQMEPVGVVIPRSVDDVLAVVEVANGSGVPVVPRAGGTSLAGQTVNHAIVIDFSKFLNRVLALGRLGAKPWSMSWKPIIFRLLKDFVARLVSLILVRNSSWR